MGTLSTGPDSVVANKASGSRTSTTALFPSAEYYQSLWSEDSSVVHMGPAPVWFIIAHMGPAPVCASLLEHRVIGFLSPHHPKIFMLLSVIVTNHSPSHILHTDLGCLAALDCLGALDSLPASDLLAGPICHATPNLCAGPSHHAIPDPHVTPDLCAALDLHSDPGL